jgi:hypothetical protein
MGWTSYHATHYKNGKIDRKAECDAYFLEGLNRGYYEVLKSSMVGSTYYAAVKPLKKYGGRDENGNTIAIDIPKEEQRVFAVIFLTSTDMKDYYNFAYKDMDESCGPCHNDCPKGILDLLTPTESAWANEWRKACYENLKAKRNPNGLSKLPVGSVIKIKLECNTKSHKAGDEILLTKTLWPGRKRNRTYWLNGRFYYTPKFIGDNYEIVKRGEC